MDKRYRPIAYVAGCLFAVNVIARLIVRLAFRHNDGVQSAIGLACYIIVGVTFAVFAYWCLVRFPGTRAVGEILAAWALACLATVIIGPFASLSYPFAGGAGDFFQGIWIYGAVGLGAAIIGALIAIGAGKDYRAQALRRFASTAQSKPRRVVRR
jgi:hypothetical protein